MKKLPDISQTLRWRQCQARTLRSSGNTESSWTSSVSISVYIFCVHTLPKVCKKSECLWRGLPLQVSIRSLGNILCLQALKAEQVNQSVSKYLWMTDFVIKCSNQSTLCSFSIIELVFMIRNFKKEYCFFGCKIMMTSIKWTSVK